MSGKHKTRLKISGKKEIKMYWWIHSVLPQGRAAG